MLSPSPVNNYTNIDYEIEVYDIGKTEITKDEIDDIENKVDAWIKEHT